MVVDCCTIKVVADLWNRVGQLTLEHGMKTTCHFEFWGAIRTREQLDTFFRYTDPELVYFFCDTAQHTIAAGRNGYVHVARGRVDVNGQALGAGDALKTRAGDITIGGGKSAEVLVFDLPA